MLPKMQQDCKRKKKQYAVITVVCGFTLNMKVLLMKFINVGGDQVHWYCKSCHNKALDCMKLIQGLKEKNRYI